MFECDYVLTSPKEQSIQTTKINYFRRTCKSPKGTILVPMEISNNNSWMHSIQTCLHNVLADHIVINQHEKQC